MVQMQPEPSGIDIFRKIKTPKNLAMTNDGVIGKLQKFYLQNIPL